jgi:hypothetical protein
MRPRAHRLLGSQRFCDVDQAPERGRFRPAFATDGALVAIEAAELALIIEGIDLAGARKRPRWQHASRGPKKMYAQMNL